MRYNIKIALGKVHKSLTIPILERPTVTMTIYSFFIVWTYIHLCNKN